MTEVPVLAAVVLIVRTAVVVLVMIVVLIRTMAAWLALGLIGASMVQGGLWFQMEFNDPVKKPQGTTHW